MSKWLMRGHFGHLHFRTFSMRPRTFQRKEIWPFKSSSEFSGVLEDSIFPLLGVTFSHLAPKWGCDMNPLKNGRNIIQLWMFYFTLVAFWGIRNDCSFKVLTNMWRTPKLLNGLKCESKLKTTEEQRVGAHSLAHNTLKGRAACWRSGMGLGRVTSINYSHGPTQNQHKVLSA